MAQAKEVEDEVKLRGMHTDVMQHASHQLATMKARAHAAGEAAFEILGHESEDVAGVIYIYEYDLYEYTCV